MRAPKNKFSSIETDRMNPDRHKKTPSEDRVMESGGGWEKGKKNSEKESRNAKLYIYIKNLRVVQTPADTEYNFKRKSKFVSKAMLVQRKYHGMVVRGGGRVKGERRVKNYPPNQCSVRTQPLASVSLSSVVVEICHDGSGIIPVRHSARSPPSIFVEDREILSSTFAGDRHVQRLVAACEQTDLLHLLPVCMNWCRQHMHVRQNECKQINN